MVTETYLSTFGNASGAIAYAQKLGYTFVLGDPVCAEDAKIPLVQDFLNVFETPVFVATRKGTARLLSDLGYSVNEFGYDTILDLPEYDFSGKKFKRLRYGKSWFAAQDGRITEHIDDSVSSDQIDRISALWRQTRVTPREVLFLNRQFSSQAERGVRRFFALDRNDNLIGFISCDPVYSDDRVVGYLASQKRRIRTDTTYLDLAIMHYAIETLRSEGVQRIHLGISPIADVQASGFPKEISWLRHASRAAYRSDWINSKIFNSKGLAEYKGRFRGRKVTQYICFPPNSFSLPRVLSMLILLQVV